MKKQILDEEEMMNLVYDVISGYTIDKRISGREICKRLKIHDTQLRHCVNLLRTTGTKKQRRICSDSKGYFIAKTEEEARSTIRQLYSRAMKMLKASKGVESAFRIDIDMFGNLV
jgi:transcription initiation factor IIE alpha subunit